jgi:AraC-like DNA-binding protein
MLALLTLLTMMGLFLYLIIYKFVHPERAMDKEPPTEEPSAATNESKYKSDKNEEEESTVEAGQTTLTAKDERFKQLLYTLMEEHIEEPGFAVEEFAACANLKRTQFYTKVKRVTGMSPIELLRKAHLQHAAHLLMDTDMNIDEVRQRCGFSNSTTFYNYFKEEYGMTPRQYRNRK